MPQVPYHIDYAELYRYETNVIYPPIYAGTIQVTPVQDGEMRGGHFAANVRGLDHYKEFGYKTALGTSKEHVENDSLSSSWLSVPYRFNRAIVHDGDFPHLSTQIEALPVGLKRVILGFNLFTNDVGPAAQRAPEHSDKFNATVKLMQTMAGVRGADKKKEKMTIEDVRKNKGLAKLLVLLARAKKSEERKQALAEAKLKYGSQLPVQPDGAPSDNADGQPQPTGDGGQPAEEKAP